MRILRFPLKLADKQLVHIPRWATVVGVDVEDGLPGLLVWVRDKEQMLTPRLFRIVETAREFASHGNLVYIASFQIEKLHAHVFEEQ